MTRLVVCLVIWLGLADGGQAQVVRDSNGVTEFIGLTSWSPARIIDTLRRLAPGQPIHQCAGVLRNQLGFPEASVTYYSQQGVPEGVLIVTVLEPRDSALVRYTRRPKESLPISAQWRRLAAAARDSQLPRLDLALLTWPYATLPRDSAGAFLAQHGATRDSVAPVWELIRAAGSRAIAAQLLSRDSSAARRRAAAAALVRFPGDSAVWRVLMRALRDPDGAVGFTAARVLEQFTNYSPRAINWGPEVESVRAILDGTRLFFFPLVVRTLNATAVDPALAPQLLDDGGQLLLQYATAQLAPVRADARLLLRTLTQIDAGSDGQAWRDWIAAHSRH